MRLLALQAYFKLLQFEVFLIRGNFESLYNKVRRVPVAKPTHSREVVARICAAIDIACIWYWREVLCLQRSAATACLLKQFGVPAQLVIGARQNPFKAHAWVEVDGFVVNDRPYMPEVYAVVDRC